MDGDGKEVREGRDMYLYMDDLLHCTVSDADTTL